MSKVSGGKNANHFTMQLPGNTKPPRDEKSKPSSQITDLIVKVTESANKKRQESQEDIASKKRRCAENPTTTAKGDQKALMEFTSSKLTALKVVLEKNAAFNGSFDLESSCKMQREQLLELDVPEKGELAKFISQQEKQLRRDLENLVR